MLRHKLFLAFLLLLTPYLCAQATTSGHGEGSGHGQLQISPILPQYVLTIIVNGTGTVMGTPPGAAGVVISCPPQCVANYGSGAVVTLSENPGTGQTFSGWSGGGCTGALSTCNVTMSGDTTVTATFSGSGGGGGPTAYTARTDFCGFNLTYAASCSGNPSCASTCDTTKTVGEANALLSFTGGNSDPLPFFPLSDTGGPGGSSRGEQNNGFNDPDYGAYVVIVTDDVPAHMNGAVSTAVWNMGSAGQYDAFNQNGTLLTIQNTGSVQYLFHVVTSVFHAHACSPTNKCIVISQIKSCSLPCSPDATHFDPNATAVFPRDPADGNNTMYEISPTKIVKLTLTIPTSGGVPTGLDTITRSTVVDFTSDSPVACSVLPPGYVSNWNGVASVPNESTGFTMLSGGGAPWPGIPGVAAGTPSQTATTDIFTMPANNLTGTTANAVSISQSGTTGTVVTATSLGAVVGEALDIAGATGAGATYWNGNIFTLLTVDNTLFTYTFQVTAATHATSTTGTATIRIPAKTAYQVTTAGTLGSSEPHWINAPLFGNTLTDGTAVQTNIGTVGGQGPGFDIVNYRIGFGCTYANSRLGKSYRGHGETGATVTSIANAGGGTVYNFLLATPETVNVNQLVTYTAGGNPSLNGSYTVTSIIGANPVTQFSTIGPFGLGNSTGGTISEPWGKWMTDDAIACLLGGGGAGCGTGTVAPLNDIFTLHGGSQALDPRFAELAPTGGGGINNDWGPGSPLATQGSGSCIGGTIQFSQLLGPWVTGTNYTAVNSNVTYNGLYYKLKAAISPSTVAPPSDTTHWTYNSAYCYLHFIEWATNFVQPCINLGPQFGCDTHQVEGYKYIYKGGKFFNHFPRHPNCQTIGTCPQGAASSYVGGPNPGFNPGLGSLCSDEHGTYRNVGTMDLQPFFLPTSAQPSWPLFIAGVEAGLPCSSYNVEVAYQNLTSAGTGTPFEWRMASNWNTGSSPFFGTQSAIGVISQQGDMLALSSDMMNTRGDAKVVNRVCQHPLRGQYQPTAGTTTLAVGDTFFPIGGNTVGAIFQVIACNGSTTVGATCAYVNPIPNFNNFPTSASAPFCDPSTLSPPCAGGAEIQSLGPNSCRGDVILIDVLSAAPAP